MSKDQVPPYIVFESIGEVSKDIMATAVIAALHRTYPTSKIVISTLHPEVWFHNPDVYRVYKIGAASYFYEDYVARGDSKLIKLDPYKSSEFISGQEHLIDAWCTIAGVERKGEMPRLFFTQREMEVVQKIMLGNGNPAPIFLLQANGEVGGMPYPLPWSRDLVLQSTQSVAEKMIAQGYQIVQIVANDKLMVRGARRLSFDNRLLMYAITFSTKRLFVDSFLQHAAAAFGMPSVVLWNTLTPTQHGYSIHKNLLPQKPAQYQNLQDTYIEQFRLTSNMPANPPMVSESLHSSTAILQALNEKT